MRKILLIAVLALTSLMAAAETFREAFETNRAMYGPDHVFLWNGRPYHTNHEEELETRVKPTRKNAEELLAKARAKNKEVAELGFEWKLTRSILQNARKAIEAGEYQKALNLAAQAKYHARIGIQQYYHAEQNWHLSVPQ